MTAHHANTQERVALDYYATPAWCVRMLVAACPALAQFTSVLDPSCGSGNILDEMNTLKTMKHGIDIDPARVSEARAKGYTVYQQDALGSTPWPSSGLIIMNPPYSLAFEFVQKAVSTKRITAALLRLAFMGTGGRRLWHRANPADVYVLSKRPSFRWSYTCKAKCGWKAYVEPGYKIPECGACEKPTSLVTTDASEYAWFVWNERPKAAGTPGRWVVL